jgi:hypothetical protein
MDHARSMRRKATEPLFGLAQGAVVAIACLVAAGAATLQSCSFTVDSGSFEDGVCSSDTKACSGMCVSKDAAKFDCNATDCSPCNLPSAFATCANGACAIESCLAGYKDCDMNTTTGCETNYLSDSMNCGSCNCRCESGDPTNCEAGQMINPIINGRAKCSNGSCTVGSCAPGWADCNADAADGCETEAGTTTNCGTCGTVCGAGEACVCTLLGGTTGCSCVDAGAD